VKAALPLLCPLPPRPFVDVAEPLEEADEGAGDADREIAEVIPAVEGGKGCVVRGPIALTAAENELCEVVDECEAVDAARTLSMNACICRFSERCGPRREVGCAGNTRVLSLLTPLSLVFGVACFPFRASSASFSR
jgi:hypothetical protein